MIERNDFPQKTWLVGRLDPGGFVLLDKAVSGSLDGAIVAAKTVSQNNPGVIVVVYQAVEAFVCEVPEPQRVGIADPVPEEVTP